MQRGSSKRISFSVLAAACACSVVLTASSSASPFDARASEEETECVKTYIIKPSGKKILGSVKLRELSPAAIEKLHAKEAAKYEGFDYVPTGGRATRKQNCAGYVMKILFGRAMQQANVEPDGFFRKIIRPYGEEVSIRKARRGDVVVYRDEGGVVKHVAIVESGGGLVGNPKIRTKDGDERPYLATFPRGAISLSNDPLIAAHAGRGKGSVEFWRLDHTRVSIREVSPGLCDGGRGTTPAPVKPKPKPPAAGPSLELVESKVILDHVGERDLYKYDKDAGTATFTLPSSPKNYVGTYSFPMPKTIPPAGAKVTFEVTVEHNPGGTVAQALSLRGDIETDPPGWAAMQAAGTTRATATATVTLKPHAYPEATKFVDLDVTINYGHGPTFRYHYRVVR